MNKHNLVLLALAAFAINLVSVSSFAGFVSHSNVVVSTGSTPQSAWGSVSTARYSTDTVQYIGCQIDTYAGSAPTVGCTASDSAGHFLACSSSDATMIAAAQTVGAGSRILFTVTGGVCQRLEIIQYSYALW